GHLKKISVSWMAHYNRGRPHSSLGPGIPDPQLGDPPPKLCGHQLPSDHKVVARLWADCITNTDCKCLRRDTLEEDEGEKIRWRGGLLSVQPRTRLTRSFDERSHS